MMSRTQPPLLDVGDGLDVGRGFFVDVGLGLGPGLSRVGLGAAVEVGAGAVVAWLGDGAGAVTVGTEEVGAEAGSTTAVAGGRLLVRPAAPGVPVALAGSEESGAPQPSSVDVLAQSPPGRPGNPPEAIACSLQLSPDQ
jgi:hypothetical protein